MQRKAVNRSRFLRVPEIVLQSVVNNPSKRSFELLVAQDDSASPFKFS